MLVGPTMWHLGVRASMLNLSRKYPSCLFQNCSCHGSYITFSYGCLLFSSHFSAPADKWTCVTPHLHDLGSWKISLGVYSAGLSKIVECFECRRLTLRLFISLYNLFIVLLYYIRTLIFCNTFYWYQKAAACWTESSFAISTKFVCFIFSFLHLQNLLVHIGLLNIETWIGLQIECRYRFL